LAAVIVRLRYTADKGQEELASDAGIALRTLRMIEAGEANPSFKTLFLLSRSLQCTIGQLFDEMRREV
jgi:DNA-binding XRE family transcriptional regulator